MTLLLNRELVSRA